jgi:hypothetical protein
MSGDMPGMSGDMQAEMPPEMRERSMNPGMHQPMLHPDMREMMEGQGQNEQPQYGMMHAEGMGGMQHGMQPGIMSHQSMERMPDQNLSWTDYLMQEGKEPGVFALIFVLLNTQFLDRYIYNYIPFVPKYPFLIGVIKGLLAGLLWYILKKFVLK